jgi:hypothetical protein
MRRIEWGDITHRTDVAGDQLFNVIGTATDASTEKTREMQDQVVKSGTLSRDDALRDLHCFDRRDDRSGIDGHRPTEESLVGSLGHPALPPS